MQKKTMLLRTCRRIASATLLATASLWAAAQGAESYPDRSIRLIVPFGAGSGADSTARVIGTEIGKLAGQTVVVDNKGGANGFIGTDLAARAAPDGYTLLLTSNTHIANKFLFKQLPYDPMGDFKPVSLYKKPTPLVLVVAANSPFKTLADVTAAARRSPGKLSYASGNSSSRVGAELYKQLADVDMLYVPYKSNPDGLKEVMAGRVDVMFSDVTACLGLVAAGKLRALMVTDDTRLPTLPNVPTAAEAGQPKLEIGSWGMFLAPKGTPDAVVQKVNGWINEAVKTPAVKRYFEHNNGVAFNGTPQDLERFMKSETEKWGNIIQRAGIQPE